MYGSNDNATDDQRSSKLMLTWRRVFVEKKHKKENTNVANSLFCEYFFLFIYFFFCYKIGHHFELAKEHVYDLNSVDSNSDATSLNVLLHGQKVLLPKYTFSLKVKYLKRWEMVIGKKKYDWTIWSGKFLLRFFVHSLQPSRIPAAQHSMQCVDFFSAFNFKTRSQSPASKSHITSYLLVLVVWQLFWVDMCSRVALHTKFLVHVTP